MERILRVLARPSAFILICLAIFGIWGGWVFLIRWLLPGSWEERGLSGDTYGSLNALFTGMAFAGLIYTIVLQKLSRIDDDREKKRQQFEATFFQLLRSVESLIDNLDFRIGSAAQPQTAKGRDCFSIWFGRLESDLKSSRHMELNGVERVRMVYEDFYERYQADLGHYYRSLYHIFKYIYFSCPNNGDFYAHFVRAQLSNQQVLLLFYNCMSNHGSGFKPLVEEFALLKHLPTTRLVDSRLITYYHPRAYGK